MLCSTNLVSISVIFRALSILVDLKIGKIVELVKFAILANLKNTRSCFADLL